MSKRKTTNLRLFSKLAQKVYKISKKQNLGWTWHDAQRWASKNIYKDFKGQFPSKIRATDISKAFDEVIQGKERTPIEYPQRPIPQNCFDAFQLTDNDVEEIHYWSLEDVIFGERQHYGFDDNLNIHVNIEGFLDTGIIKKKKLTSFLPLISSLNKKYNDNPNGSYFMIFFKRLYIDPTRFTDHEKYPCNTYLLVTNENSTVYNTTPPDKSVVTEKDLSPELQEKRQQQQVEIDAENKAREEARKAKGKDRPKKVEGEEPPVEKPKEPKQKSQEPEPEPEQKEKKKEEIHLSREDNIRIMLGYLKEEWEKGLWTNKEYKQKSEKLRNKLESGGII